MTTRLSKIARLPKAIRDQLAARIEDNHLGTEIVHWLNSLPEAQQVLQQHFAGRPISEQNLSDWKQSGHLDWLRRQESRLAASQLLEQAGDLDDATHEETQPHHLTNRFATVLTVELTRLAMTLFEQETDPDKKWQRLCHINRELSRLRRDDHRATSATIKYQRWDTDISRQLADALICGKLIEKNHKLNILHEEMDKKYNVERFGGGPSGHEKAELLFRVRCDLPINDILDGTWQNPAKASPSPGAGTACPRDSEPNPPANASPQRSAEHPLGSNTPAQSGASRPAPPTSDENGNSPKAPPACSPTRKSKIVNRKSPQTPAKPPKSSLIKPNPGKKTASSLHTPADATPIGPIGSGAPVSDPARPQTGATSNHSAPISPISPISPINPPIHQSINPPTSALAPDPAQEAYNLWFRMNRGAAPFDPEALEKLYAAVPPSAPE